MIGASEIVHGIVGAWRIVLRDPEARRHFDLSSAGFQRSFAALALSLPVLFFTTWSLWRIGQEIGDFQLADFSVFAAMQIGSTVLYWAIYLSAMIAVARYLGRGAAFVPYTIVFNWGTLMTTVLFALPLFLYTAGLAEGRLAVALTLPAVGLYVWYHWQIARQVLGAERTAAVAIVLFDIALGMLIDQGLGRLIFTADGGMP